MSRDELQSFEDIPNLKRVTLPSGLQFESPLGSTTRHSYFVKLAVPFQKDRNVEPVRNV